jgi:DNA-binding transcriptional ArsR family regulator
MKHGPDIAATAQILADPSRAAMLDLMMNGLAYTAGELAEVAGVTPQTASQHLARLVTEGFLTVEKQGRHRYHRLANDDVVHALESILNLSAVTGRLRTRPGPRDPALREARICYDHLAGHWGVRMYEALVGQGALVIDTHAVLAPTQAGHTRFQAIGVDLADYAGKRPLCRACLDWSERKPHLGGLLALGC